MKYLIALLLLASFASAQNNTGVLMIDTLRPKGTADTFPIVLGNEVQGGPFSVATTSAMSNIPITRLVPGALAFVTNDSKFRMWNGSNWSASLQSALSISNVGGGLQTDTNGNVIYADPMTFTNPITFKNGVTIMNGTNEAVDLPNDAPSEFGRGLLLYPQIDAAGVGISFGGPHAEAAIAQTRTNLGLSTTDDVTFGSISVVNATQSRANLGVPSSFGVGPYSVICGGRENIASNNYSVVVGGEQNIALSSGLSGHGSFVGAGYNNQSSGGGAIVSGQHNISDNINFIGVGIGNKTIGGLATGLNAIAGGQSNLITFGYYSVIGGGIGNKIAIFTNEFGTELAAPRSAFIGGGSGNQANNTNASVLGGNGNTARGRASAVLGGTANTAAGEFSVAAGYWALATNNYSFVWSSASTNLDQPGDVPFASTNDRSFNVQASGGMSVDLGTNGIMFRNSTSRDASRLNLGFSANMTNLWGATNSQTAREAIGFSANMTNLWGATNSQTAREAIGFSANMTNLWGATNAATAREAIGFSANMTNLWTATNSETARQALGFTTNFPLSNLWIQTNLANARTILQIPAWATSDTNYFVDLNIAADPPQNTRPLFWRRPAPNVTNDLGKPGDIAFSTTHLYICVATNQWKRVLLGTW